MGRSWVVVLTDPKDVLPRQSDERLFALAFAVAVTALAWIVFARLPPMSARIGVFASDLPVPAHYQAAVFPAFAAFVALLAADIYRRRARRTWTPRVALLLVTGALSIIRLYGVIPLSGHAVFLFAAFAYELVVPIDPDAPLVAAAVIPGLLVTGWYKVAVWGDLGWFAASAAFGAALGAGLARWARRREMR